MNDRADPYGFSPRVLEVGHAPRTALCGYLLAGLGARVTKLATPERAADDPERAAWDRAMSIYLDRGKAAATGPPELAELDVVLAGSDAELVERLGTGAAGLRASRPGLVVALATEFGRGGEYRTYAGGDLLALALGGLLSMIGERGREPLRLGGNQAEYAAGLALFTAVLTGLYAGERSGTGALVETSAVRAVAYLDWKSHVYYADRGTILQRGSDSGPLVLECADGYVGFYYRDEEWPQVKQLVGDPRLADERFASQLGRDRHRAEFAAIVNEFSRRHRRAELYHRSQARHIPAGSVLGMAELVGEPQLTAREFFETRQVDGVPVTVPKLPWTVDGIRGRPASTGPAAPAPAPAQPPAPGGGPLAGLTVVDFGTITAGGRTTQLLGDFGATVIKVEGPARPDPFRHWSGVTGEAGAGDLASPPFRVVGRNKEAVAIDLKQPDGIALLRRLVEGADLLVENFRRGVMERLGLGFETLRSWNPRICLLSISSQGADGPERDYVSFGGTLEALGGMMAVTGYGPAEPTWTTSKVNYPDQAVALLAPGLALWSALVARRRGRGVHIDLAQRETVVALIGELVTMASLTGTTPVAAGNLAPGELGLCLPARGTDEWVAVSLTDEAHWRGLVAGAGRPELAADPRFASPAGRRSHHAALAGELAGWSRERDKAELARALRAAGVPAAPVLRAFELPAEEPARGESLHVAVPTIAGAPEPQVGWPFTIDGPAQPAIRRRAPRVGEDTLTVLRRYGVEQDRIDALLDAGVIAVAGSDPANRVPAGQERSTG
ncbi:MAG TPA: CoA transferase [Natronosporangium sp.]